MAKNERKKILFMSTYPPRKCGIATFTQDLATAISKSTDSSMDHEIIAMNKKGIIIPDYPEEVVFQINDGNIQEYTEVANKINKDNSIKLVNIQHEFGIFGGYYGKYLLKFIEALNKPLIVTFHTVVPHSIHESKRRKRVVRRIAKGAKKIVVLNKLAIDILREDYGLDGSKIVVIPHGIHEVSFEKNEKEKVKFGYKDRIILTTFGFFRKSKGYEYIIEALPEVIKKFPNVLYIFIGETHPAVRKWEGESYLNLLKRRVSKLDIQGNVKFIHRYVDLEELIRYLKASDLYICATKSSGQITSGTLAYAMGCGRAVVATPFLHAKEIVNSERGVLLGGFKKPKLISEGIIKVLSNPSLREEMERNAYEFTRHMTWSNVADSYLKLFNEYME